MLPIKVMSPQTVQTTSDKPTEPDRASTPPGVINIPAPIKNGITLFNLLKVGFIENWNKTTYDASNN